MNTLFKGDNKNLLVLGGIALAAAYFLMNRTTTPAATSGTSGGALWGGSTPQVATDPTMIYQFPAEAAVNFPSQVGGGLADLLNLLTGGLGGAPAASTATKKETSTGAGYVVDQNGKAWQPIQESGGLFSTILGGKIGSVNGGGTVPTYSEGGADRTRPAVVGGTGISGSGDAGATKKEAATWNSEYIFAQNMAATGNNVAEATRLTQAWGNYISGDPNITTIDTKTGAVVDKYAGMITNYDFNRGNVGVTKEQWNSFSAAEQSKVIAQMDPNYVVGSWVNPGSTKKETSTGSDGGSNTPGNSYSAETAASAPAGIDMSSAPASGGSWDDYW